MNEKIPRTGWCLTSGHAGHEQQALGILEELGIEPVIKRVNPEGPHRWLSPWGPAMADPTISPPWPDIVVASSRLAAPYARSIRRRSKGTTFTAFLQDPGAPASWFDFVWANDHDRLRGKNVMKTLTAPHRVTLDRLRDDGKTLKSLISPCVGPFLSVVLGGRSDAYAYRIAESNALAEAVSRYGREQNLTVLVTPSRRTPDHQISTLKRYLNDQPHWIWDGAGENPYFGILGLADELLVTCDSVNMMGEAAYTGKPLHLWQLKGGTRKFDAFHTGLLQLGAAKWFDGNPAEGAFKSIDSRSDIAEEILRRYALKLR